MLLFFTSIEHIYSNKGKHNTYALLMFLLKAPAWLGRYRTSLNHNCYKFGTQCGALGNKCLKYHLVLLLDRATTNQPVSSHIWEHGHKCSIIWWNTQHCWKCSHSNTGTAKLIMLRKEDPVWFEISGSSPDSSGTLEETFADIILASVNVWR